MSTFHNNNQNYKQIIDQHSDLKGWIMVRGVLARKRLRITVFET